ncbi:MAG: hypothetical protein OXC64_03785 [Flavobacteriaceae bacterium]|nr:hypothetical protein [Flavobacteriaceae bacterium]
MDLKKYLKTANFVVSKVVFLTYNTQNTSYQHLLNDPISQEVYTIGIIKTDPFTD